MSHGLRSYLSGVRLLLCATFFILLSSFFISCTEEKEHIAPAIYDRDSVSMMTTYGVNTLISDSGMMKYRIITERWDVNTIKTPSRWEFMKGIFLQQYDKSFHVEAFITADTAWYYDQLRLWHLRGRVRVRNVNGLYFTSEELFWDGMRHEIYSYCFSRIVTPERTLQGTYFRSDERMTHYLVTNSKGSFQSEDMEKKPEEPKPGTPAAQPDTARQNVPVRQVAPRHAATTQPQQ